MHFGIISPPVPGHLYPNGMIARELINRGYRVTIYNIPDTQPLIEALGIGFHPIATERFPLNTWHTSWAPARTGSNLWRHYHVLKQHIAIAKAMLEELPALISQHGIDVLLVDQLQPQGAALAAQADIPFLTLCSILPIAVRRDGRMPPAFAWWHPTGTPLNGLLNRAAHRAAALFSTPYLRMVNHQMRQWQLPAYNSLNDTFSPLLQLGVIPAAFDYPEAAQPPHYIPCGPFVEKREQVPFPWASFNKDSRPLIYVSMGTIRNSIAPVYKALLKALEKFTAYKVVLSLGGWTGNTIELDEIPRNILVVGYAPQPELLAQAVLCITHAGPGTVMECVHHGVPMVCIPVTDDQPAMAARVEYHAIGRRIPWRKVNAAKLERAIREVLTDARFTEKCRQLSATIQKDSGASKAADAIEAALKIRPLTVPATQTV
ncbi:glycosyltransferase [Paraflavitalea sp. CAU 1676]|uniref:glycosyltransferase n=1 Tax=Paraflavitalea sp. CAU 1676 TaxID=3032598 RepID=UPI0023DA6C53|nr:glycosyltransferase [Paraflavitalea sp. CAU 1676]MDF2190567.1 glycosyltransferase [Paraflavitalea sp. CAU 1676]